MAHHSCRAALCAALTVGLLLVPGSAPAQSQTPPSGPPPPAWDDSYYPYGREGFYMGLGAVFALENFDTDPAIEDPDNPTDITADDAGGLWLRAGYRVHPRLAAEVMFQYYWGFQVKDRNAVNDTVDDSFDGWTMTANAKLYPLLGRFQPYALAGVGGVVFNEKKGDDSGFIARMGGGMDIYITDHFLVDVEIAYLFPGGSISELQFATFAAGVQYRY